MWINIVGVTMLDMASKEQTKFSKELVITICDLLGDGKSLRTACKEVGIQTRTFYTWLADDEFTQRQYARAKEEAADNFVEEMLEIADEKTGDPNRDRLRLDTRKWIASKLKPKRYGDKLDLAVSQVTPVLIYKPVQQTEAVEIAQEPDTDTA